MPLTLVEVSPRDGLQNESAILSTADKLALIERAASAGLRRIEVASFVNPTRVPQMADAEAILEALQNRPDISRIGLVLNRRGLDRALRAGIDEINFVLATSETFAARNQGASVAGLLQTFAEIAAIAHHERIPITATLTTAFGCPFEGEIPRQTVAAIVAQAAAHHPAEIALADTIGVAAPTDVTSRFTDAARAAPQTPLRAHFHNTRNTGLANAYAALQTGVHVLDSSIGGIGGCPFAPAATGNIPTEDLAYMLQRMGHLPEINLSTLIDAANWLPDKLGHPVPGLLARAGLFPV